MEKRQNELRSASVRGLLLVSRLAFSMSFVLAMMTPAWERGTFTHLPLYQVRVSGQRFQIGILVLLPVLAAVAWMVARLLERPRRPWQRGPAHIAMPVVVFGALALIRAWPVHIVHTAVVTVIAIAMFWASYLYVLQDGPARWVVGMLAILLLIQGAIGTIQFLRQGSVGLFWMGEELLDPQGQGVSVVEGMGRRWVRAYGMTAHPNVLGGYLSMTILICLGSVRDAALRFRRWLWPCIVIGGVGLFFTFSRSAWIGTLAGLCTWCGIVRPWRSLQWQSPRTQRRVLFAGAIVLLCAVLLLVVYGDLLITRFFRLRNPLEEAAIKERLVDMRQAWGLIRTVPLKGTGSGYYIGALWAGVGEDRPPGFRRVHNTLLLAAAELGIGGAILWLWMFLSPLVIVVRQARSAERTAVRAGWAAAFVSGLVLCMFDSYLYIPSTWWPALYIGVLTGSWARENRMRR